VPQSARYEVVRPDPGPYKLLIRDVAHTNQANRALLSGVS